MIRMNAGIFAVTLAYAVIAWGCAPDAGNESQSATVSVRLAASDVAVRQSEGLDLSTDARPPSSAAVMETPASAQDFAQTRYDAASVTGIVVETEPIIFERASTIENDLVRRSLNQDWYAYFDVPHFVVRGRFETGTTRCALANDMPSRVVGLAIPKYEGFGATAHKELLMCVTDFYVDEYMFGTGSKKLSLVTYIKYAGAVLRDFKSDDRSRDYGYEVYVSRVEPRTASKYEGREWILWIAPPHNLAVKAWDIVHYWKLDRDDSDANVTHSQIDQHLDTPENRALLIYPLEDYRATIIEAFHALIKMHDGRIGDHEDLPLLLSEATDESLDAYIRSQGGYEWPERVTPATISIPDRIVVYPTPTPVVYPTPTPKPTWMTTRPTDLVAISDGRTVTLNWTAPNIDPEIVGYQIWKDVTGNMLTVLWNHDSGTAETKYIDDQSVESGKTYHYSVSAITVHGEGFGSLLAEVTVP